MTENTEPQQPLIVDRADQFSKQQLTIYNSVVREMVQIAHDLQLSSDTPMLRKKITTEFSKKSNIAPHETENIWQEIMDIQHRALSDLHAQLSWVSYSEAPLKEIESISNKIFVLHNPNPNYLVRLQIAEKLFPYTETITGFPFSYKLRDLEDSNDILSLARSIIAVAEKPPSDSVVNKFGPDMWEKNSMKPDFMSGKVGE